MSSLATRYRPRKFEQLHGQEHATQVLAALVSNWKAGLKSLPSGILLTGPRGGGKTTSARVLAAAVNCEAESGTPCGACVFCQSIFGMSSDAVLELDGATSGSAEVIRDLASKVRLAHSARIRVVIIDECHAMSPQGFSALLKQLEEPPPAVMYVLVTTDLHQVPDTIASRCLVFPFRLIAEADIVKRLVEVCDGEQFTNVEPGVLELIASRANGALRDALMLLEHLSITDDFTVARGNTLWPDNSREFAANFLATALEGNPGDGINVVNSAFGVLRDSSVLMDAISKHIRERAIDAHKQGAAQALRTFSEIIRILWDFRIGTRTASPTDPTPLEGLWFTISAVLAKNRPASGFAGSSLLERQRAAKLAVAPTPPTPGLGEAKQPGVPSVLAPVAAGVAASGIVAAVLGGMTSAQYAEEMQNQPPADDSDDILKSLLDD